MRTLQSAWHQAGSLLLIAAILAPLFFWGKLGLFGLGALMFDGGNALPLALIAISVFCLGCLALTLCGSELAAHLTLATGFLALFGGVVVSTLYLELASPGYVGTTEPTAGLILMMGIVTSLSHFGIAARCILWGNSPGHLHSPGNSMVGSEW